MDRVSIDEAIKKVEAYINSHSMIAPFFVNVDDAADYRFMRASLHLSATLYVSDYCDSEDSVPDFDKLFHSLRTAEKDTILIGLGDALTLLNSLDQFYELQGIFNGSRSHIVVLCRQLSNTLVDRNRIDAKFNWRRYCIVDSHQCAYSIARVMKDIDCTDVIPDFVSGFKSLLKYFEEGREKKRMNVRTNARIPFSDTIKSHRDALVLRFPEFDAISEDALLPSHWRDLCRTTKLEENPLIHWRTFTRYKLDSPQSRYLVLVVRNTATEREYVDRLFDAILKVDRTEPEFAALYDERKRILADARRESGDTALSVATQGFLSHVSEKGLDTIYYLTDQTDEERREIIRRLIELRDEAPAQLDDAIAALDRVYPDLAKYMKRYKLRSGKREEIDAILTDYFEMYKRCKLLNKFADLPSKLEERKTNLGGLSVQNALETRGNLISLVKSAPNLRWLDALSADYLGFIRAVAAELEMSLEIRVGRAFVPTVTELNKAFFDDWNGEKKNKNRKLDVLLHDDKDSKEAPLYLVDALRIIREELTAIRNELASGVPSVALVSDHGATRLYALCPDSEKTTYDAPGDSPDSKRGGRCATVDVKKDCDRPDVATEETLDAKRYWAMATYDRFKGGKFEGAEAHGGATLEEVVVPVILFTPASVVKRTCEFKDVSSPDERKFNKVKKIPAKIKIHATEKLRSLTLRLNERDYDGEPTSMERIWSVPLNELYAAGKYQADVYEGDNLVGTVEVEVKAAGGGLSSSPMDFLNKGK